ncbi:MAG: AMP-binding protein [Pseudonocardia sp.]|nr:AMP-binding protein [Pseudonocardia sp.]
MDDVVRTEPDQQTLLRERTLSSADYWAGVEARTEAATGVAVSDWFNTAHEVCDRWADDPTRLALTFRTPDGGRDEWTYARLRDDSRRLAAAYRAAGLRRGDRVAALLSKRPETYVAALAAWRSGLVHMPMFVGLGSEALAHRMRTATPAVVVVDAEHRDQLGPALALLDEPPAVWCVGPGEPGDADLRDALAGASAAFETVHTAVDEGATLMFTSGTTGPPKGCLMPHSLPLCNRSFAEHCFALRPDDVMFCGADPGWSYGLYTIGFSVLATGHRLVVHTGGFDPEVWLRTFAEEGVTYIGAAPSALRRLVAVAAAGEGMPPSVRGATCAGEPLDAPLGRAWQKLCDGEIRDGYGQTEGGMVLANLEGGPEIVPGALSSVVPGFDVALLPEDSGETPLEGEAQGIIALRRPRHQGSVTYWNAPELWAARWRGEWFLTGDVARRDAEGRYWFVGRGDDLIITSGYNVGPTEVESVLLAHPSVLDAAVVGAPDPARGTVVRAVLVADPDADREALVAHLQAEVRERIGRHAYPRIVDFVDELPRTESGKIKRNLLRG